MCRDFSKVIKLAPWPGSACWVHCYSFHCDTPTWRLLFLLPNILFQFYFHGEFPNSVLHKTSPVLYTGIQRLFLWNSKSHLSFKVFRNLSLFQLTYIFLQCFWVYRIQYIIAANEKVTWWLLKIFGYIKLLGRKKLASTLQVLLKSNNQMDTRQISRRK